MSHEISRRSVIAAGLALGATPVIAGAVASPVHAATTHRQLIGPAPADKLHVMTYNIRYAHVQPPNSWPERRPLLRDLLTTERPTVLGTQEGVYLQLQDVLDDLPPFYDWLALHREGGSQGEAMAVLYDTNRLKPLSYDHLWLSDTPRLIGSKGWGNNVVRMLTWVRFLDKPSGKQFVFLNTHFDHQSEPARQRSAAMIRDTVATFDVPVIVTGDFNTEQETSASYRILVTDGGLTDAWVAATDRLTPAYGTFNFWNPTPEPDGNRIDWILTTPGITTSKAAINTYSTNGQCPSDHWPVQVLVKLP